MKRSLMAYTMLLLSLTILSGCWDEKAIQNLRYVSAIGIDFVDNQYVVYAQAVAPSSVAKQENTSITGNAPAIIAIGRGDTLQNALDNIQKNSQVPQFYGFVSSLVFHERMLKKEILPTFDVLNRFSLLRYSMWVFGTREPLEKVFGNHSIVGFSPLVTLLHEPYDLFRERSFIEPIQYYKFTSTFWEPSNTVILPNVTIYKHSLKENEKFLTRPVIEGIHTIHRGKWQGFFQSTDLLGLRWMNPQTTYASLIVRQKKQVKATLRIQHVKLDVVPVPHTAGDPRFKITIHLNGFVKELMSNVSAEYIRSNAETQVKEQVKATYLKGIKKGSDVYGLESVLYKKDLQAWKAFAKNHDKKLSEDALAEVNVLVYLSDSGKMKLKWYDYPETLLP